MRTIYQATQQIFPEDSTPRLHYCQYFDLAQMVCYFTEMRSWGVKGKVKAKFRMEMENCYGG